MTDGPPRLTAPAGLAPGAAVVGSGGTDGGETSAGATAPGDPTRTRAGRAFRVEGLDCAEEIAALRREVGPLVGGGERLAFDLIAARMLVDASAGVSDAAIVAAAARAGLHAAPVGEDAGHATGRRAAHGLLISTASSALALLAGLLLDAFVRGGIAVAIGLQAVTSPRPAAAKLAYLLASVAGGWFVVPRAWAALRGRRPDMNLLMTVAVAGALGIGEWLEAATVSFLFALSLLLEAWSVGRARRAVRGLLDLAPPFARRADPATGAEVHVPVHEIEPGDTVIVHPGERVPLDGQVSAGRAHVDASPVTGESRPRETDSGDEVWAGVIVLDGALTLTVTRQASDTVLARIVRRVAEAGRRRGRVERWVDSFARVYTPAVLAAAVSTAALPPLLGIGDWSTWLYRGLVLLVIGCPCALVISTPVGVVAALAAAARRGVLVKGGDVLELSARVAAVALDKTGTLTAGVPDVVEVIPLDGHDRADLLRLAAGLELRSGHPIADAVRRAAQGAGLEPSEVVDSRVLPGRGVEGTLDGRTAWLGSHRLLEERGEETADLHRLAAAAEAGGHSVVVVGENGHVCGLVALSDRARPGAAAAVAALRRLGVRRVAMLTGDNVETANSVAAEVGIDEVHASLLPEDKIAFVGPDGDLARAAGIVAFVGDGINDAPALAAADLGIAMGTRGSDAAIEAADVALMADDLGKVPWLIRHARRAMAVIRANVGFALAVKGAFVLLTFAGAASLWAAIAADMGASLVVIFNALRLLRPES